MRLTDDISIDDDVRAQIQAAQHLVGAAIYGGNTPLGEIPVLPEQYRP